MIFLISTFPRGRLLLLWRLSCGFCLCSHYATFISLNLSCAFRLIKCCDQKYWNILSSVPIFSFCFVFNLCVFVIVIILFLFSLFSIFPQGGAELYSPPEFINDILTFLFLLTNLYAFHSPYKIYSSSEFHFWSVLPIQHASTPECIFLFLIVSLYKKRVHCDFYLHVPASYFSTILYCYIISMLIEKKFTVILILLLNHIKDQLPKV